MGDYALFNKLREILNKDPSLRDKEIFGFVKRGRKGLEYRIKLIRPAIKYNTIHQYPFFFNPDTVDGGSILKIDKDKVDVVPHNLGISGPNEFIQLINMYKSEILDYIDDEGTADPRAFKDTFQKLVNFCSAVENISYPLFTEEVDFTFPRNLLNTFQSMVLSGYENCGTIAVSKIPGGVPVSGTEEYPEKFATYEVFFHSEKEAECITGDIMGSVRGEIQFHNHPLEFQNQNSYAEYIKNPNKGKALQMLGKLVYQCFSIPSGHDLSSFRDSLTSGRHQINIIFAYPGVYLFRTEKLIKDINIERKIRKLTDEELNEYKTNWNDISKEIIKPRIVIINGEPYNNLYSILPWVRKIQKRRQINPVQEEIYEAVDIQGAKEKEYDVSDEMYQNYVNLSRKMAKNQSITDDQKIWLGFYLYRTLENIYSRLPSPGEINYLDNAKAIIGMYYDKFPGILKKFSKDALEYYLNIDNNTGNKIIAEFYPVEFNQETGLFEYPIIKVRVSPMLLVERQARAPRRLTIQTTRG